MKLIMENWRGYLEEQERIALEENIFNKALDFVKEKGRAAKEAMKSFLEALKVMLSDTEWGIGLLQKIANGQQLTDEEVQFLKEQAKDIASGSALLALFILPGGGLASAALVRVARKFGVELMPAAFAEMEEGRDWQKDSSYIKDHEGNKEELIGDGGQDNSEPYEKNPIKKRSKSAPPAG